ncbi:MAG: hypothetical protein NC453_18040 [Muribaculum sp.]|nr:hypothetical protein [Muribaculum sp.]
MMDGFVILHRSIMDMDGYLGEPFNRAQCWIDLIMLAQWQDTRSFYKRGIKVVLRRGQIAISLRDLAERWTLSVNTVTKRLNEFVAEGKIEIQKSKLINTITVVNYEKYQSCDTQNDTHTDTQNDTQFNTQTDTQVDTQLDTSLNKDNKDNKYINISSDEDMPENSNEFPASGTHAREEEVLELEFEELDPSAQPVTTLMEQSAMENHQPRIFSLIRDLWCQLCPSYPKLQKFSESRKNKIRVRISEMGGDARAIEMMKIIFAKMEASSFLKGDNKRGWKASFDWLFSNSNNWVKVYEGNYDNRPQPMTPGITITPLNQNANGFSTNTYPQQGGYVDRAAAAKAQRDAEFASHIAAKIGHRLGSD